MSQPDGATVLTELGARTYLGDIDLPLLPATLARDRTELEAAVQAHGDNLVLKVAAPWLVHKSDLGLVRVGIRASAAAACFDELVGIASAHGPVDGILVSPRIDGAEMIVGLRCDEALGPFVLVGAGGVLVEILDDIAVAPAPVGLEQARVLVRSVRASALLDGRRGSPLLDLDALATVVATVSRLHGRDARLVEIDLNPVIVGEQGATVIDARIVQRSEPPPRPPRTRRDLLPLFDPASVAVIGASSDPNKLGARLVRYLVEHGYPGRIVPVHSTATEIHGISTAPQLPGDGQVDVACIAVPVPGVVPALEACAAAGIRHAIVHTSGFSEAGSAGVVEQSRLAGTARTLGISVCGPNSLGIISPGPRVFTSFAGALEAGRILRGRIGFVSQSGALASSLLSRAGDEGIGFSRWVSSGNEVDLDLGDYVSFLAADPETSVIALFVEQIREGEGFRVAVREAVMAGKPVLAFKSGRSDAGRRITQSHTGALAGDDRLYSAFLRDAGVVRVASLRDLLDAARVVAANPRPRGRRLGAVTMSGGASSVIADLATELDLPLPAPDATTSEALTRLLPRSATTANPLDVTAAAMVDPRLLTVAAEAMMASASIDIVLVQLTTNADPVAADMAHELVRLHRSAEKPLLISRLGSASLAPRAMEIYRTAGMPVLTWPEDATRAAWALAAAGETVAHAPAQQEASSAP